MRKFVSIALYVAVVMLFSNVGRVAAQPMCSFINNTPAAGPMSGDVTTSVDWSGCPASGNTVEVALFQIVMGKPKALGTKSVNNVGMAGAKTWVWTGLTVGIQVQANITVYDSRGTQIAQVGYTPNPPLTVK